MSSRPYRVLSRESRHVIISVNPRAGPRSGDETVEQLVDLLTRHRYAVEVQTDIEKVATRAAASFATGKLRTVVAAGGDGTAALVANRIPANAPLTVLPLGTENLLSKYVDIPQNARHVFQVIDKGGVVQLDAGRANGRLFLLMVGCGFDAEVVRRLHDERSGHIHQLSYVKPILESIRSYQYPELRIYCLDGDSTGNSAANTVQKQPDSPAPITAKWAFVINLPRYAAGLQFAPHAVGTDGLMDVCSFKEGSFLAGLWYLTGIVLGQHESWSDCVRQRCTRLRIESDGPVPYQLDGDPGGFLPVEIEILPSRLTLLVDEAWACRNGFSRTTPSAASA